MPLLTPDPATAASGFTKIRPARDGDDTDLRRCQMELALEQSRDRYGRAPVRQPDGSTRWYRRASGYGAPNESEHLLTKWKLRKVAEGIATRPALRLAVTRLLVRLESEHEEIVRKAKGELDQVCEDAMTAVGAGDAASIGTSLHDVLELDDLGRDTGYVPDEWQPDLAAYRRLRRCFETLSSELIVVNDLYRVIGKFDRAIRLLCDLTAERADGTTEVLPAGTVLIGDVKTAQSMEFAGCKFGCQCWAYANSVPYDPRPEVLARYDWPHEPPRTDWAVILHVPSGKGLASLHWVDLDHYAPAMADVARTHSWRNSMGKKGIRPGRVFEDYATTAARARSVDELMAAYGRATAAGEWTDEVRAAFSARRRELEVSA